MRTLIAQFRCATGRLARDASGAVLLEYVVVTMVGLTIAVALLGLGTGLVGGFTQSLSVLYGEYP